MKIKHLKEWCESKDDDDVVFLCIWDDYCEDYSQSTSGYLHTRPAQKKDFIHHQCKHFESIEVKGESRRFCNRRNDFLDSYKSKWACNKFEYSKEYDYCRECNKCHKRYCKYVKDDSRIYVGDGFVSKY